MFENVIGYASVKNELLKFYDVMTHPEYYARFNAPLPRGILLYGSPGVGKTLCATELISNSGRNVYTIRKDTDSLNFINYIRTQFNEAKNHTPSIVFLDDLDKFGDGDYRSGSDEYRIIQTCIDETKGYDVFIVATANDIGCFPSSLIRPGRFDRLISMDAPSGKEAELIMSHYLTDKPIDKSVDVAALSKMLDGHSCATLESVIYMASIYAGYERSDTIKMNHITEAILAVVYDKPQSDFKDDYKYLENIAYHEAGHAVISEILIPGSTTLVTVRQKHEYDNPFTLVDNKIKNTPEILNDIRIFLGGKAAVEMKYGYCDMGAISDLDNVYNMLYGLIGRRAYKGFYYASCGHCGEKLADRAESIMYQDAEQLFMETKNLLYQYWTFEEAVVQELLRKETLIAADIANIKYCLGMIN